MRRPKPRKRQSFFTRPSFSRPRPRFDASDLDAGRGAIDRLKHQLERDAPLHFADDDEFWNPIRQADEIAAAHLAFDLQTESFEMTLDR